MDAQVEFYGPVDIYGRREDGEWVVWADPFSEVGTGPTFEDALDELQENLEVYLRSLAEEVRKHGDRVQVLTPLDGDLRKAERTAQFFVYAVRVAGASPPEPVRAKAISADVLIEALKNSREVHVTPALCQA